MLNKTRVIFMLAAAMLVISACSNEPEQQKSEPAPAQQTPEQKEAEKDSNGEFVVKAAKQRIEHVHGIGYPGNDDGLYVASHHGLRIFKNGEWLETTEQLHDYMGFQAVEDGFYASGHPEEGSELKNPLGLVKSTDQGKSLDKVAFYGESDFHFLSASYKDSVLYLINEEANSELERGIYVSRDNAKSWETVELNGFEADTFGMIAVHPENGERFAMSTREGVFLTEDYGKNIRKAGDYELVTAASFSKESLYISPVQQNKIKLLKLDPAKLEEAVELKIPTLNHDNPITYIAAHPEQEGRIAFITILNDLFESQDGGQTWKQLLVNGRIE
ncbi:F510_1955 family glycosylhydrolase [Mesobacillus subterraneus]|uniref:Sortilin N-terminal domain-containing protein n=1 Tax=Mesobacillus subterraneus TaxID=285983 RepID=A0A3R9DQL1_9BACI|nr:hypothetical protein [Mesobacillus subterraneus]RSD25025.1 hypothetical protein EJA10_18740 [Mesobacillus subterraneus]